MPYIKKEQRKLIDGPSDFTVQVGLDSFLYKMDNIQYNDVTLGKY